MRLVLYEDLPQIPENRVQPGILKGDTVVSIEDAVASLRYSSPQQLMEEVIGNFEDLRPDLERLSVASFGIPLSSVRLRAPLPRPSKILGCIGNYWEHIQRDVRPLNMFLKSPDAVIGPGDTVVLPNFQEPTYFTMKRSWAS